MADITNQQLLDVLSARFEDRFDSLEKIVAGISDTVVGIAGTMATSEELTGLKEEFHEGFDNLELRLGRRIDAVFSIKAAKTAR